MVRLCLSNYKSLLAGRQNPIRRFASKVQVLHLETGQYLTR
jgi:hypothetical protein